MVLSRHHSFGEIADKGLGPVP